MRQKPKNDSLGPIRHVAVVIPSVRQAVEWYTRTFHNGKLTHYQHALMIDTAAEV